MDKERPNKTIDFSYQKVHFEGKNEPQKQPSEVLYKKGVLRNFTKFTVKELCQSLFLNKVAGLTKWSNTLKQFVSNMLMNCLGVFDHFVRPATLLKKGLSHRYFPVSFVKFLGTPFSQNTSDVCFWTHFQRIYFQWKLVK